MKRYPPHKHFCATKNCGEYYECSADPEVDEDGSKHCPYDTGEEYCEDCQAEAYAEQEREEKESDS